MDQGGNGSVNVRNTRQRVTRDRFEPLEVCRVSPSILYSGDILSDMAIGDTLVPVLPDRLEHLIRTDPVCVERLIYTGLN